MIIASLILALLYFGFSLVDKPIARWLSTGCALAATYCFVFEMTTRWLS